MLWGAVEWLVMRIANSMCAVGSASLWLTFLSNINFIHYSHIMGTWSLTLDPPLPAKKNKNS